MPARGKVHEVPLESFLKSDSDDLDFDATESRPRTSRKSKSKLKSKKINRRSQVSSTARRFRKERYSSSDIVSDSESDDEDEGLSSENDNDDESVEYNATGRPTRRNVKTRGVNYIESDDSDDEVFLERDEDEDEKELNDPIDEASDAELPSSNVISLSISPTKLRKFPDGTWTTRKRITRSPSVISNASHVRGFRKRTRSVVSAEPEAELYELDTTGRPAVATKGGASKRPVDHPSTIIEASMETSILYDESENPSNPPIHSIENIEENASVHGDIDDDDDDGGSDIVVRKRTTNNTKQQSNSPQKTSQKRKRSASDDDDFNPDDVDEDEGSVHNSPKKSQRNSEDSDASNESVDESLVAEEIAEELDELRTTRLRKRARRALSDDDILTGQHSRSLRNRGTQNVNYALLPPEVVEADAQSDGGAPSGRSPTRNANRGIGLRGLFSTVGAFGGAPGRFDFPFGNAAVVGDDSSDDETPMKPVNAVPGMPPITPQVGQTHNFDTGTKNMGRGSKKDNADITPLAVSAEINFDNVGGLDDHINQLKEMVMLPLLYPDMYGKFKISPPRGVLFHGPPGTGKTLLARALASTLSKDGQKVSFYMRKGADVMSKWVGEAERQLRVLFEEAKKNQPAIIFFDEFDGLAPVRSSKQEQIHASIVTTLLALMDGMDNRGQIVVIGATNRPDSIDPAFRRPGRFDREFYFPLPNEQARRAIIDIHTRGWEPVLQPRFKDRLAQLTKGYGGSDLRALCTEACINAVQRTYPQIYKSEKKLVVDTSAIVVKPKDFLLSIQRIVPSSARQTGPISEPLPSKIEPLLRRQFADISKRLSTIIPQQRKKLTALEEAEYDDPNDDGGFDHDELFRAFERGRIFRPRLLIKGVRGMGQKYLSSAILHKLENFFVSSLDLSSLYGDSANTPESFITSAFKEARSHQPSVIYIPQVNIWYETVGRNIFELVSTLVRSLAPNDAVLVMGMMEMDTENEEADPQMLKDLFGFSKKHEFQISNPDRTSRSEYFEPLISYFYKRPHEFPDPANRKKRKLPDLALAKEEPKVQEEMSEVDLKASYKSDRSFINNLRVMLTPILENLKKFRQFRNSAIPEKEWEYLMREEEALLTDEQRIDQQASRPYELMTDKHGNRMIRQVLSGKTFYNCNLQIIEARLQNGCYCRIRDFMWDLKTINKDWNQLGNADIGIKANTMYGNAMADSELIESQWRDFLATGEEIYKREQKRAAIKTQKTVQAAATENAANMTIRVPMASSTVPTGPVQIGEPVQVAGDLSQMPHQTIEIQKDAGEVDQYDAQEKNDSKIPYTNGDSIPSQLNGLFQPGLDLSDLSSGTRPQFPPGNTITPSNPTTQGQTDADKSISTSSGMKSRESDGSNIFNTQPTSQHPTWSNFIPENNPEGSQLPDTIPNSEYTHSGRNTLSTGESNGIGEDPFPKPGMTAREMQANATGGIFSQAADYPPTPPTPPPPFVIDEHAAQSIRDYIIDESEGLSVEQLEMIDARCMGVIWEYRGSWDRSQMLEELKDAVDEVLEDIQWQKQFVAVSI